MRKDFITKTVIKIIIAFVSGFFIQLIIHELGHALFAILTGNTIKGINIGLVSYIDVEIINQTSIGLISLGSFIFSILIWSLLIVVDSKYLLINMLRCSIISFTLIQLGINLYAITNIESIKELMTYDLGIYLLNTDINRYTI